MPGEPLHNQGNLYIGKSDSLNFGFSGCVADILIVPRVLLDHEILNINRECLMNLNNNKSFGTFEILAKKFERDSLIQKYALYTGNPEYVIENLELTNDELREIVKKFDTEVQDDDENVSENAVNNDEKILQSLQLLATYQIFLQLFLQIITAFTFFATFCNLLQLFAIVCIFLQFLQLFTTLYIVCRFCNYLPLSAVFNLSLSSTS